MQRLLTFTARMGSPRGPAGPARIYVGRGLDPGLAKQVAYQLMANDALGAHAREELGFSTTLEARPI